MQHITVCAGYQVVSEIAEITSIDNKYQIKYISTLKIQLSV